MAFKLTRESRRKRLKGAGGFCAFEARELSKMPLWVPYWKHLRTKRKKRFAAFMATEKATRPQFERMIAQEYKDNKWLKTTKTGRVVADPWAMLREFEDRYKDRYPEYESPWLKKRMRLREFKAKLDAHFEKRARKQAPARRIRYLPEGGAEFVD